MLQKVNHFVHHNVFETLFRLFGEFEVHPYSTGIRVAGAPFRFHFLDAKLIDPHNPFLP